MATSVVAVKRGRLAVIEAEADIHRSAEDVFDNPRRLPLLPAPRLAQTNRPRRARAAYAALVDRIRADGWSAENYQFPFITEERRAGSTLLQRLLGLVDVRTDREVGGCTPPLCAALARGCSGATGRRPRP